MPDRVQLRLRVAAARIGMSIDFLRRSDCPRHRVRGNGPKGRPILLFYADEVDNWWREREVGLTPYQRAS